MDYNSKLNIDLRIIYIIVLVLILNASSVVPAFASSGEGSGEEPAEAEDSGISVDLTGQIEGYSAVLYDNSNGLPTSEANAITETSEGFIWIGSYSGLMRYDGNTFERFDSTTGIASVTSLFVDSRDRLWIGTNDGGAAVMENGQIRMFNKSDGLASLSVRSITEEPGGIIYIATTHGIVTVDGEMSITPIDEPQINDEYIRQLMTGDDGIIYGLTQGGSVFTIENRRLTGFYDGNKMGLTGILSIFPDPRNEGYVYIGTEESTIYYGKLENSFSIVNTTDVSPLLYVNSMELIQGKLWICAVNGTGYVENNTFTKLENIPMNDYIDHVTTDYEGNLWFTSSRQGVMKIVPNQFMDIFEKYDLPTTVVNSTCMYEGLLFVATDNGLIALDEDSVVEGIPLTGAATASGVPVESDDLIELLKGSRIRSIIKDREGRMWLSTYSKNGLIRYENGHATCFTTDDGMPSGRVRTVYQRADGVIMAACSGGVALIQGDSVTEVYGDSSGLSNTEILTVAEAANGDMIFGSDGDGIYIVSGHRISHIGVESGLSSGVVMRVKKDSTRDIYWIVTSNSLAYMTGDYKVSTIHKFPYSNNFDMYESSQGDMWILSSNGIYVVPVEELLANGDIFAVFFNKDNGLSCVATANSYSELTESGDLYVAGSTGVSRVNIDVPLENVNNIKMAVPFVEADGRMIYADGSGTITVPAGVRKLTIYSFVYTYSLLNPKVTYHLEGFDQNAVTVSRSELKPVDYTNLGGGTYRFVMELSDSLGRGSNIMSVLIEKQKEVHEQLWFQIICVLLIIALIAVTVAFYVHKKTAALLKKERENRIFIREMTEAFARTIDLKDEYTNGHSTRVAEYTVMLARELGCSDETIEKYYNIALLHDIGKIGIPSGVLNKKGKLTDEEYEIIKSHSSLGYNALKDISIMPELATGAGAHHERPDGKGYPNGLKGDEIPRAAQIIAVADTFDAMYSDRPYRRRMNFEKAVSIIKEVSGTQLTSDVVDAFLRLVERGEFRAPDDTGGGTTEDIDNLRTKS